MRNRGFTLIETIIYITLFSLILTGGFITAFELLQGNDTLMSRTTIVEEGNFVINKIEWALYGISDTTDLLEPSAGTPTSTSLSLLKARGESRVPVVITFDSASSTIHMQEGTLPPLPLTTENVRATGVEFVFTPASISMPANVSASTTINGFVFTVKKYLPQ